jgi:hypothetical protein
VWNAWCVVGGQYGGLRKAICSWYFGKYKNGVKEVMNRDED